MAFTCFTPESARSKSNKRQIKVSQNIGLGAIPKISNRRTVGLHGTLWPWQSQRSGMASSLLGKEPGGNVEIGPNRLDSNRASRIDSDSKPAGDSKIDMEGGNQPSVSAV